VETQVGTWVGTSSGLIEVGTTDWVPRKLIEPRVVEREVGMVEPCFENLREELQLDESSFEKPIGVDTVQQIKYCWEFDQRWFGEDFQHQLLRCWEH